MIGKKRRRDYFEETAPDINGRALPSGDGTSLSISPRGSRDRQESSIDQEETEEQKHQMEEEGKDDNDDEDADDDDVFHVEVIEPPTHFTSSFRVVPGSKPAQSSADFL